MVAGPLPPGPKLPDVERVTVTPPMVEDPVARVRFPRAAAAATLEWQGQTVYFIGEETRREFEKQQGIGSP